MKYTFLSIISLLIISTASAQRRGHYSSGDSPTHEISVYGLGGLSSLNYKLSGGGTTNGGVGGGGGVGYTFNINDSWGITTGVEIGIFGGKATYGALSGQYEYGTTGSEAHFKFRYSLSAYEETQSVTLFSVPVMAQFKTPLSSSIHFYLAGGFKLGLPVSAKATITPGTATTSGEFSYEQVEYDDLERYGFGTNLQLVKTKSDIDLGFSAALALETGLRFSLSDNIALGVGAYLDYGLNSVQSVNDKHILNYQFENPQTFIHNSVLNTALTDKINLFSAGVKIKIAFGM
jgi:hypothetical protein